ncbi:hypothetical protein RKD24_003967 [Streptomyces calvus]
MLARACGASCSRVGAPGHTGSMSSRRRPCPECRREIAVVAGRYARHDPPGARGSGELTSCPGSRRPAPHGTQQPSLDGYVVPEFPGQMPLF